MRGFYKGFELRLEKEDVIQLLEQALNDRVFKTYIVNDVRIKGISLHPGNKYVVRLEMENNE